LLVVFLPPAAREVEVLWEMKVQWQQSGAVCNSGAYRL
jgi:hypothetical protein